MNEDGTGKRSSSSSSSSADSKDSEGSSVSDGTKLSDSTLHENIQSEVTEAQLESELEDGTTSMTSTRLTADFEPKYLDGEENVSGEETVLGDSELVKPEENIELAKETSDVATLELSSPSLKKTSSSSGSSRTEISHLANPFFTVFS